MNAGGSSTDRRRLKAALFVVGCAAAGIAPHALGPATRLVPGGILAALLGGHGLLTVLRGLASPLPDATLATATAPGGSEPGGAAAACPAIDVVVAARDEQAVIARLVERVAALRWPEGRLRLWVIDDGSEDRTPEVLAELQPRWPLLRVLRRPRDAGGGKSGALNRVLRELEGHWLLVLDADADLQPDTLERLIPFADAGPWDAVQLRKAVVNASVNLLTRAQAMEMAFDALLQEGRLSRGGGRGAARQRPAAAPGGGAGLRRFQRIHPHR